MRTGSVFGNLAGLAPSERDQLERTLRRRVLPEEAISLELARHLGETAARIGRQVGVLIDRGGVLRHLIVGDALRLPLPDLSREESKESRFLGLRLVHIHLRSAELDDEDLSALRRYRLDLVMSIGLGRDRLPAALQLAHLLPFNPDGERLRLLSAVHLALFEFDCLSFIPELEREFSQAAQKARRLGDKGPGQRALLVGLRTPQGGSTQATLNELSELAHSAGLGVAKRYLQTRQTIDARTLIGRGKMQELALDALDLCADMIVFDRPLTPAQARSIAREAEVEVLDRNQLILAIFGQRAQSRAGRLQVELASLRYELPRLSERAVGLSRITGGIGAQGPGETKLEIHRRRVKDRIARLEHEIKDLSKERLLRRKQRLRSGVPVVALVGYTNAGKSTLFNQLTASKVKVLAENRLFATLDPTSRRIRFDAFEEFVLSDTVGFIRDLPEELTSAFRATLEELSEASLLLHVVDLSNPDHEAQITAVERILDELELAEIPRLLVFNKCDLLDEQGIEWQQEEDGPLLVSAHKRINLDLLLTSIRAFVRRQSPAPQPFEQRH